MKKFALQLLLALVLVSPSIAVPGQPGGLEVGWLPSNNSAGNAKELTLANGARWIAYSFVLSEAKTLNSIGWYIDYIQGAITTGDVRYDIYSDASAAPNASLANSTVTSGSMANASWVRQTGYSLALSAGVRYWVVARNVDATPLTNYLAIKVPVGSMQANFTMQSNDAFFAFNESVNSGASWNNDNGYGLFPLVLEFSDSTYFGLPMAERLRAADDNGTFGVYATRERGSKITTPANAKMIVKCLTFQTAKVNAPTGAMRYRIYQDTTLIDTTATVATWPGNTPLCFTTPVTLLPSTVYRFVVSETTQADSSTDRIGVTYFPSISATAAYQELKPFGSATAGTYYNGATWSDLTTEYVPFVMTLEKNGEFAVSGTNYGGYW